MRVQERRAIVFILLLILVLVGCGGGGDNSSSTLTPTPDSLPPDPGEAGKLTLQGIDSDDDGVRDDIQIALEALGLSGAVEVNSATHLAKGVQSTILAGSDGSSDTIRSAAQQMAMAVDCASYVFGIDATDRILMLEFMALNTEARSAAYENFNALTEGQQFGAMESQEVACD